MKTIKLMAAALLLAAGNTHAAYFLFIYQSGPDVLAYGSGTLNLAGPLFIGTGGAASHVEPVFGVVVIGATATADGYDGIVGPGFMGGGGVTNASSSTGDKVGVNAQISRLIVPSGYVSGAPLESSSTWTGTTIAALGFTPGIYNYDWGGDLLLVRVGVVPQVGLAITQTDGVTTATPGGSVTYTITASNTGPANATGATVADTFPASLTVTWTCVGAGGGTCTAAGAGNINDTVNLPAGGSVTYTASATISASATGSLSNTATVTAPAGFTDPVPGNNSATDTDTLTPQADLAITKTDGVVTATPGGSVTYTITASNAGPSNATGATVADTFPASLTATWTCVGAGGGTCTAAGAGNINDTVNLPAGGSVTYTASAIINPAATGTLTNTATVAAPGGVPDPNPANNSATDTDTLVPAGTQTFSGPSATGTGTITASFPGVGACAFNAPQFIGKPPGAPPIPPTAPGGVEFPYGLFDFSITGCVAGATVVVTITYPQPLPGGTRYYKYGPTLADPTPHWYVMPAAIAGNTVTFTLVDGGLGDDDLAANGTIVDQGGPGAITFNTIPTLDPRGLLLLVLLIMAAAAVTLRRRS